MTGVSKSSVIVFAAALAVRVAYLFQMRGSPLFFVPLWDAADYHDIALGLSQGRLHPSFPWRPPLYPLLLGGVYTLFGEDPWLPRLLQALMGAGSCVLVQRMARRLFGPAAGVGAGLAAALSGMMFYHDLELLPTGLEVFLSLWVLNRLTPNKGAPIPAVKAGLLLGLLSLARPTFALFIPVALVWVLVREGVSSALRAAALAGAVLALSTAAHLAAGYGPVVVSAQGGVNFYLGNHHAADGITAQFPGLGVGWSWDQIQRRAEFATGRSLSLAEVDRFYYGEGWREIRMHPAEWAKLMWRKARLFWNRIEISNTQDLYYLAHRFWLLGGLLWLGFPVLIAPALIGGVVNRNRPEVILLAAFVAVLFAAHLPFFINARFRHPATPVLMVLAAGGAKWMWDWSARRGRMRELAGAAAAAAIGVVLPWSASTGIATDRWDYGLFSEGKAWEEAGDDIRAAELYRQALEVNPNAPFVNGRLAEIAARQGRYGEAVTLFRRELQIQPQSAGTCNNLGLLLLNMGEESAAMECWQRALELQPFHTEARRNLASLWNVRAMQYGARGQWFAARDAAARAVQLMPEHPNYQISLLKAKVRLNDTIGVRQDLSELLKRFPEWEPAKSLYEEIEGGVNP